MAGWPEAPELAVDAPHGALDALAQLAVGGHALAARRRDLHEHGLAGGRDTALRAARGRPAGARRCPWCSRAGRRRAGSGAASRAPRAAPWPRAPSRAAPRCRRSRRSRSRRGMRPRAPCAPDTGICARAGVDVDQPAADLQEVLRSHRALEADEVGSQHALDDLLAPWQLHEQLLRRQRDVQEEADAQIGPQRAQERGHEVQLVVVHPDGRARRGHATRSARRSARWCRRSSATTRGGTRAGARRRGRGARACGSRSPRRTPRSRAR